MADVQSKFTSAPNFSVPTFRAVLDYDSGLPGDSTSHRRVGIQVDTEIQPVASRPYGVTTGQPEYHFFVSHQCMFSPDKIWTVDDSHSKGWYVQSYKIETSLLDDAGHEMLDAVLVQSKPETKSGVESYTSSLSQSISGNLGFMGDAPMAGVAGSVSWSESHSFEVTDVTMTNTSDLPSKPPGSAILMAMRDSVGHPGGFPTYYYDLDYPATLATTTFQPVVLELWRLPRQMGQRFRLKMTVTCTLAFMAVTSADTEAWTRSTSGISVTHVCDCPYAQAPI
ncbi:MAG: hypothetical protein IPG93_19160 [Burkholderiales bacterium]|nr:hypothetical protein [Burkholderiales bacterium]